MVNNVNFNLNFEDEQLQIDLSTLPPGCHAVVLNLPDGNYLTHQFNGFVMAGPAVTLDKLLELIGEFVEYLELCEELKENTLKGYRNRLRQFAEWLRANRERDPGEPSTWLAYLAFLKQRKPKLSDYTRKGHYHILNRFGDWLVKKGHLRVHPLKEVSPPALPKNRLPKAIYQEHIKMMLAVAETPRDRAILMFFRDSGCRATEAISLTWGDVHLDEGKARGIGKREKERWLYFKPVTQKVLRAYRETVPHKKSDPVWWGRQGTLTYEGLYKVFQRLANKVDIGDSNFNPHAWRHAFGRDTTKAGIPTAQLQDLLGHSSMEVTKVYAQFNDIELQEAHNRYSPVEEDLDASLFLDSQDIEKDDEKTIDAEASNEE